MRSIARMWGALSMVICSRGRIGWLCVEPHGSGAWRGECGMDYSGVCRGGDEGMPHGADGNRTVGRTWCAFPTHTCWALLGDGCTLLFARRVGGSMGGYGGNGGYDGELGDDGSLSAERLAGGRRMADETCAFWWASGWSLHVDSRL